MIFSSFKKKKWQHKNPTVRIEALTNELSINDVAQRQIVAELALTDEAELVRRAALIKLASFDTWLQHSQQNTMVKIQRYATKQIESILTDSHEIKVEESVKLAYINDYSPYVFFETWLKEAQQANIIIALFEKIARKSLPQTSLALTPADIKPHWLISLFSQKQNSAVQAHLVALVDSVEILEKLLKKAVDSKIEAQIINKINAAKLALEKPLKLSKQVNLTLAKLQALQELSDYGQYLEKRQLLEQQWQQQAEQFSCLSDDEVAIFSEKQQKLSNTLDKMFASKAQDHAQLQIKQQIEQQQQQAREHFDKTLSIISHTLTTSIFENDTVDEQQYQTLFDKVIAEIIASVLSSQEQQRFLTKVSAEQKKLKQLPEIAESVTQATHLISRVSQLALPNTVEELIERLPIYQEWLRQWQQVELKSAGTLPDSIKNASQQIQANWLKAIKPLEKIQKQAFGHTQRKISDVSRLIANGKFNAAFGVFNKAKALYQQLSGAQQHRLQRDYSTVEEKISELADWEHYIATPRKQQLLLDIQVIVDTPLDNPNEQAEKVKYYRKQWNSLGHADDEAEQTLNHQFNALCETAFAPCRLYFAAQEKLRHQHLKVREGLILEAKSLAEQLNEQDVEIKHLETQLNQLQKKWHDAGQVDRQLYQTLQKTFVDCLHPVKAKIKSFHHENVTLKQALIEKATATLAQDDVFAAINEVKVLQQQWREIGYAGVKFENKLWQQFRCVNDQIFTKRDNAKANEKSQLDAQRQVVEQQIQQLNTRLIGANDKAALQQLLKEAQALTHTTSSDKRHAKRHHSSIDQFISTVEAQLSELQTAEQNKSWQNLFLLLSKIAENNDSASEDGLFAHLTPFWQKKIKEMQNKSNPVDRHTNTLELEILAGVPSPEEYKAQRMQVQVSLMQDKMLSGAKVNLVDKFAHWLTLGKFTQDDLVQLSRIKGIFVN